MSFCGVKLHVERDGPNNLKILRDGTTLLWGPIVILERRRYRHMLGNADDERGGTPSFYGMPMKEVFEYLRILTVIGSP